MIDYTLTETEEAKAKVIKVRVYKQVAPRIRYVARRGENHVHTIANTAGWIEDG